MADAASHWIVIPAAGFGERMQFDRPKQYISINDKTVLEHTLEHFTTRDDIAGIVVVIAPEDTRWPKLEAAGNPQIITVTGGTDRFQSVLNGLKRLADEAVDDDWVMVHDAARPCLSRAMIDRLIAQVGDHDVGGILGLRCRDTMKQVDDSGLIELTVARERLWHAQTPQMFRYAKLVGALARAIDEQYPVTDEAMAMELSGYRPLIIAGHPDNIKLTHRDDLEIVRACLNRTQEG